MSNEEIGRLTSPFHQAAHPIPHKGPRSSPF